ncbi:hypothetical protein ACFQJD_12010 [Haloplanus sp. GCM10025708]|uniref:hypothetical protein n=1 Tax=Haloferacaceae TaxID=1644056 RepID=UPI0036195BA4
MSSSSPTVPTARLRESLDVQQLHLGVELITAPLRFVSFWAAVALPFLYLPLLYGGLEGQQVLVFGLLVVVNVVALVLGHDYGQ